ncbi:flavin reductase family protein [Dasania marina]|mgnify:CR=1 FL=1|uniref:flavin reductase family protein n=1 Tax=Dasania marina TaxID=471499 RepID=UPI0030D86D4A|tara:strand:- start:34186 stop:34695 length:510 start_codon:yes stop_codon:yes gene_type:complete
MLDMTIFKEVMGQFPTGVAVITCDDGKGGIVGFTASSFTSVSVDPALVLFCPQYNSDSYPYLESQERFAVHILEENQKNIAYAFASKGENKAKGVGYHISDRDIPILDDYLAVMECILYKNYEGGDHAIVVGEVIHVDVSRANKRLPMVYCRGKMGGFSSVEEQLTIVQ